MKPFFSTAKRIEKLREVIASWEGTPFRKKTCLKGSRGGVDCAQFVMAIVRECGQLPDLPIPEYVVFDGGSPMAEKWHCWVKSQQCATPVTKPEELQSGDVLFFRGKAIGNHTAIVLDPPFFWHSLIHQGVCQNTIADSSYMKSLRHVWRPVEMKGCA